MFRQLYESVNDSLTTNNGITYWKICALPPALSIPCFTAWATIRNEEQWAKDETKDWNQRTVANMLVHGVDNDRNTGRHCGRCSRGCNTSWGIRNSLSWFFYILFVRPFLVAWFFWRFVGKVIFLTFTRETHEEIINPEWRGSDVDRQKYENLAMLSVTYTPRDCSVRRSVAERGALWEFHWHSGILGHKVINVI